MGTKRCPAPEGQNKSTAEAVNSSARRNASPLAFKIHSSGSDGRFWHVDEGTSPTFPTFSLEQVKILLQLSGSMCSAPSDTEENRFVWEL